MTGGQSRLSLPNLAAAAATIARQGLPVFPCRADKTPACAHGCKDAATDPNVARQLFLHARDAVLIGLATGARAGIAVIDFDPQGLPYMRARLQRGSLPETRIHQTPRGGYHFLYRYPTSGPPLRNSASKLAWGVDIRGEGGYVIIPPSPGYAVANEAPIERFPAWVLVALRRRDEAIERRSKHDEQQRAGSIEGLAQFVAQSAEGERNARLFWAACRAGENRLGTDELVAAAVTVGLSKREAMTTAWSGSKRGARDGIRKR